jgi:hypothetical protein
MNQYKEWHQEEEDNWVNDLLARIQDENPSGKKSAKTVCQEIKPQQPQHQPQEVEEDDSEEEEEEEELIDVVSFAKDMMVMGAETSDDNSNEQFDGYGLNVDNTMDNDSDMFTIMTFSKDLIDVDRADYINDVLSPTSFVNPVEDLNILFGI